MNPQERLRRWRLVLGGGPAEGTGCTLSGSDVGIDQALATLYDQGPSPEDKERNRLNVGMGASRPKVARWLGDIRQYFPSSVVRILQQDALERLGLKQMLLEPEMLQNVEPDVHLVGTLLSLQQVMPATARQTARLLVQRLVTELEQRLANPTRQAVLGSLNRATRNQRPRHHEIDWHRTIRANLKHYQPQHRTIIPVQRIGFGRKQRSMQKDIVLCVDQSGSMATSVVYAGIFGAVLASISSIRTRVVVYDTAVVDLTDLLSDPVEVLFGTQLGGGNDTPKALDYCQSLIERPSQTVLVLISDLYEGHGSQAMIQRLATLAHSGVQVVSLLALSDEGKPSYDHPNAAALSQLGIPVFACTPDLFPDLMATALTRQDISQWAASQNIVLAGTAKGA